MATKLDLADAQFIGWRQCKSDNSNVVSLVSAMGLTKKEWIKWLKEYPTEKLTENEKQEINKYFNPPLKTKTK